MGKCEVRVGRQFKMRAIKVWMVETLSLHPTSAQTEMPSVKRVSVHGATASLGLRGQACLEHLFLWP